MSIRPPSQSGTIDAVPIPAWQGDAASPNLWALANFVNGGAKYQTTSLAPSLATTGGYDEKLTRIKVDDVPGGAVRFIYSLTTSTADNYYLSIIQRDSGGSTLAGTIERFMASAPGFAYTSHYNAIEIDLALGCVYVDVRLQVLNVSVGKSISLADCSFFKIGKAKPFIRLAFGAAGSTVNQAPRPPVSAIQGVLIDLPCPRPDGQMVRLRQMFSIDGNLCCAESTAESFPDSIGGTGNGYGYLNTFMEAIGSGNIGSHNINGTTTTSVHVANNDFIMTVVRSDAVAELRGNTHGGETGASGSFLTVAVATAPAAGTSETWTVQQSSAFTAGTVYNIENEDVTVTAKPTATTITVTRGANSTTPATHASGRELALYNTDFVTQYDLGDGVWRTLADGWFFHQCRRVRVTANTKVIRSNETDGPFVTVLKVYTYYADGTYRVDRTFTFAKAVTMASWLYRISTYALGSNQLRFGKLGRGSRVIGAVDYRASLTTPVNSAFATATTGGTLVPGTYSYRVAALSARGETVPSKATTQVVPAGTNTNTVTVNWAAVAGAVGYRIYGRTAGVEHLLATVGAVTTWIDDGSTVPTGADPLLVGTGFTGSVQDGLLVSDENDWSVYWQEPTATTPAYAMANVPASSAALPNSTGLATTMTRYTTGGVEKTYISLVQDAARNQAIAAGDVYQETFYGAFYYPADPVNFEKEISSKMALAPALPTLYPAT